MSISKSSSLLIIVFLIVSSLFAEFPAEESWRVNFRSDCRNFTTFQSENSTGFLVALENSVAIIEGGDITWSSDVRGTALYPAMIDFNLGNGYEVIVSSYTDSLGYLTIFNGDNFENSREVVVGDKGEWREDLEYSRWDNRLVRYISDLNGENPDSLQKIVFNQQRYYDSYYRPGGGRSGYTNRLFVYSTSNEAVELWESNRLMKRIQTYDYNQDGEMGLIGGGSNFSISHDRMGDYYSSYCKIFLINKELEREGEIVHIESRGDYFYDMQVPRPVFNGMAIGEVSEDEVGVFVNYSVSDTLFIAKAAFDSPEDITRSVIDFNANYNAVHLYDQNVNDERVRIVICVSRTGHITLIDVVTLEVLDFFEGFPNGHIISYFENFDNDDDYELAYLTRDALHLYDIGALNIPDKGMLHAPKVYSIIATYPNPFNSNTTVSYGLPTGGMSRCRCTILLVST